MASAQRQADGGLAIYLAADHLAAELRAADTIIRAINDCVAVFASKIGGCPKDTLKQAGIEPVDSYAHEFIERSVIAYYKAYLDQVESGEIVHQAKGDAEIRQGAYVAA